MKNLYYIEVTDTFGGEANYSWVTRHIIKANVMGGAINKFSRLSGMSWRNEYGGKYVSKSGATCYFIAELDEYNSKYTSYQTDERDNQK